VRRMGRCQNSFEKQGVFQMPDGFTSLISITLAACVIFALTASPVNASTAKPVVVDGDTVKISGRVVRLIGLDAPESKQLVFGLLAKAQLTNLCKNGVQIKSFKNKAGGASVDKYGRELGVLLSPTGKNINIAMIESGLATPFMATGGGQFPDFRHKMQAAEKHHWLSVNGPFCIKPSRYRRLPPWLKGGVGQIVIIALQLVTLNKWRY
jgi:endonuclease YncB( thermonuclease family)